MSQNLRYSVKEDGYDIICQCEYGESRSSGCAAAILGAFLWDRDFDFCRLSVLSESGGLS